MRTIFACAILFGLAAAGPAEKSEKVRANDKPGANERNDDKGVGPVKMDKFLEWCSKNNKSYSNYSHMQMRSSIFNVNDAVIDELNLESKASGKAHAARFEHNFTSDYTQMEFEQLFTGAQPLSSAD